MMRREEKVRAWLKEKRMAPCERQKNGENMACLKT